MFATIDLTTSPYERLCLIFGVILLLIAFVPELIAMMIDKPPIDDKTRIKLGIIGTFFIIIALALLFHFNPLSNDLPVVIGLAPNEPSPQEAGKEILWTAETMDSENGSIVYKFFHNGPSTGGSPEPMTKWIKDASWKWRTSEGDIGQNQIEVWVRDGKHKGEGSFDDRKSANFTIKPPNTSSLIPNEPNQQEAGTAVIGTSKVNDHDVDPNETHNLEEGASTSSNSAIASLKSPAVKSFAPNKPRLQEEGTSLPSNHSLLIPNPTPQNKIQISPEMPTTGMQVELTFESIPSEKIKKYQWSSNLETPNYIGDDKRTIHYTFARAGNHRIAVEIIYSNGTKKTFPAYLQVLPQP